MEFLSNIPLQYRLQITIVILCIAEAWLEVMVIKLKNPSLEHYPSLNKQEHQRSALYYGALVLTLIFVAADYKAWFILVPLLLIERRVFFEYSLKVMRGRGIRFIEGDQFWDRLSREIFGYKGGVKELLVLLVLITVTNFIL